MNNKKKIILYLCGGLGNQLFQYAAAKSLAIKNNANLEIDSILGFLSDFKYQNKCHLKKIKKKTFLFFWIYRLYKIFFKKNVIKNFFSRELIDETSLNTFSKKIKNYKINKILYLMGFFQSEKYFYDNKKKIVNYLYPSKPKNKLFHNYKKIILSTNSVAICIRSYEGLDSNLQKKMGGVTPLSFYKKSIKKIIKKINDPVFFLFSTSNKNVLKILNEVKVLKNYKYYLITEENGFIGAAPNLWLLSYFKNLIISNSSLYWWGAYFSKFKYKQTNIFLSKNFINKDFKF